MLRLLFVLLLAGCSSLAMSEKRWICDGRAVNVVGDGTPEGVGTCFPVDGTHHIGSMVGGVHHW
jgi:hypothetical protein